MADVQFDFNPVDWTGFSVDTVVLDEGYALWFKNHPDGDGYCQVIGDGSSVVSALTPLFASGPKYLTAGRKFADENPDFISYSTSGWKQIAHTASVGFWSANADFRFYCRGISRNSSMGCKVAFTDGTHTKVLGVNCDIKAMPFSTAQGNIPGISGYRIGTAAASGQGATLEIYADVSSGNDLDVFPQIFGNFGESAAWELETTAIDSTGLTPGGSTATYLEAGAGFEFDSGSNNFCPDICSTRFSDDQLRVVCRFEDVPKQDASSVAITLPSIGIEIRDNSQNTYTLTGTETISNVTIYGKIVAFYLNSTGAFSGLTNGDEVRWRVAGSGFKITLS